jgi:hypothetical protein
MGRRRNVVQAQVELARIATRQGDSSAARHHCDQGMQEWLSVGHPWGIAEALESYAYLALAEEQAGRAVRLIGATAALREARRFPLRPWEQIEQESALTRACALLEAEMFRAAWSAGYAKTQEQAVAEARESYEGACATRPNRGDLARSEREEPRCAGQCHARAGLTTPRQERHSTHRPPAGRWTLRDRLGLDAGRGVNNGPLTALILPEQGFFSSR